MGSATAPDTNEGSESFDKQAKAMYFDVGDGGRSGDLPAKESDPYSASQ